MPQREYIAAFSKVLARDEVEIVDKILRHPVGLLSSEFKIPDGLKRALEKRIRMAVKETQAKHKIPEESMATIWSSLKVEKEEK